MLRRPGVRRATLWSLLFAAALLTSALIEACDSGAPTATAIPAPPSVATGDRIFAEFCNSCHPGGERGAGPALKPLLPMRTDEQIREVVRHGKVPMPGYSETSISNDDLTSLVMYLRTMK